MFTFSKSKVLSISLVFWAFSALPGGAQVANGAQGVVPVQVRTALPPITNQGPLARQTLGAGVQPASPAPGLSLVFVYAVQSQNCGVEYMTTRGQISTVCDHGGSYLATAVLEIGYGGNPIAWMNGAQLPRSANFASTPVCVMPGQYYWPCRPGETVVGYLNEYDLSGQQGGFFAYQNTSINFPNNTMSTSISIR